MRFGAAIVRVVLVGRVGRVFFVFWAALASTSCGRVVFKEYEYEEDVYLSLDGSATVYVNASLASLDALRGASFDAAPRARFNRDAVRAFFSTPVTRVVSVSNSRRSGRRFAHVRLEVDDVRRLGEAAPFAWSSYHFALEDGLFGYQQVVGAPAGKAVADVNWTGGEIVAFRLHLPSTVRGESAREAVHERGNILAWEQQLADRLHGRPVVLAARMETGSILSHTLRLFGATFVAVAVAFGAFVWWIMRHAPKPAHTSTT
jgi:hypothetical protein